MMNFNDIKAFIDFASDTKKYKAVVDQLDERQKKWEALVETYTKVENAAKFIADADKQAAAASAAIAKERETFELWRSTAFEKAEAAKLKAKAAQEKVDGLKAELEDKVASIDKLLKETAADREAAAAAKAAAETQQSVVDGLAKEYQAKLDKINSVLKQV